jgi:hypothetical protein
MHRITIQQFHALLHRSVDADASDALSAAYRRITERPELSTGFVASGWIAWEADHSARIAAA